MYTTSIPRPTFQALVETLGKERAEEFASYIEKTFADLYADTQKRVEITQAQQKAVIKDELKNELITRDVFEASFKTMEERFKTMEERFKRLDLKLNIFMALAFITLTFANPTFTDLVKHVFK
jgi:hypothetical protein